MLRLPATLRVAYAMRESESAVATSSYQPTTSTNARYAYNEHEAMDVNVSHSWYSTRESQEAAEQETLTHVLHHYKISHGLWQHFIVVCLFFPTLPMGFCLSSAVHQVQGHLHYLEDGA
jgi:hypothetical protein